MKLSFAFSCTENRFAYASLLLGGNGIACDSSNSVFLVETVGSILTNKKLKEYKYERT